jgi:hypothetical protein
MVFSLEFVNIFLKLGFCVLVIFLVVLCGQFDAGIVLARVTNPRVTSGCVSHDTRYHDYCHTNGEPVALDSKPTPSMQNVFTVKNFDTNNTNYLAGLGWMFAIWLVIGYFIYTRHPNYKF